MITKEKVIFWLLVIGLAISLAVGLNSQEKKKTEADEFMKDMQSATEKAKARKKAFKDIWDTAVLKSEDSLDGGEPLLRRNIFGKLVTEDTAAKKPEIIPLEEEAPRKPVLVYKGRITLGSKVMVIIEDEGTGKSYSVQEGDKVADYIVSSVGDREVRLKKDDGEELVLGTVRKEKEEELSEKGPE
ncbi:MAG: hypothetical protein WC569_00205 [Candidatus Omnitrophota bacterium]